MDTRSTSSTARSFPVTTCTLCSYFAPSLKLYISHLRIVHSRDPLFQVICGIEGCKNKFRAFTAFNTHVYRHHRVALGLETQTGLETQNSTELDGECSINSESPTFESDADPCASATRPICKLPIHIEEQAVAGAKVILHLREGRKVSQVAVNDVVQISNEMCTKAINHLKQEIRDTLLQANTDSVCDSITDILDRPVPHLFEGVQSTYRFEKFCVQELGCLVRL